MSAVAIITARGGSKRIPYKNIKHFNGKPIISYSIEAAIKSKIFDEVMVSTDDENIANIAKQYGASVPFMRSESNSNDFATTSDVICEVVDNYGKIGKAFDYICCIYPTAPFVTSNKLLSAYELIRENDINSVIPVVAYSFPPQRSFVIDNGFIKYQYPEFEKTRSQDLPVIYHDVGQFYFLKTKAFLRNKKIVDGKCMPIVVSSMEVQDIDNYEDWKIAEVKYNCLNELK